MLAGKWRATYKSGLLCSLVFSMASPVFAQAPASLSFTEQQAVNGQALYYQHCLICHGEDMGGVDQAPPLAGPQFTDNWKGETLWALVERLGTMPPDKPGSLNREQSVEILSYILWYNGVSLGETALATDRDVLSGKIFDIPTTAY